MQENRLSELQAALERAAATLRGAGSSGSGMVAPMPFGGPGMFNPTPMASQSQPGMQPTPAAQVANRFGGMQPPSPMPDPAQQIAARFPQAMAQAPAPTQAPQAPSVPVPSPRPAQAPPPQPEMSFFQRNAAMMRDPVTGSFIDPSGAAAAGDQGSIIKKMLGYLHNKADTA